MGFNIAPKGQIVTMGSDKHEVVVNFSTAFPGKNAFLLKEIERVQPLCPLINNFSVLGKRLRLSRILLCFF